MSVPFYSKIESLSTRTSQFEQNAASSIAEFQGKRITLSNAESSQIQIWSTYQNVMEEISQTKSEIAKQTTVYNQDAMIQPIEVITSFETRLEERLIRVNDMILTYYPTAKIIYGEPCIGEKIPPKIDTTDVNVHQMLSNTSCIRKIRGDGNCFLSSFTTRYLESLVEKNQVHFLIEFIAQDNTVSEVLKQELLETLFSLNGQSQLDAILQDNHKVLPFINYFRQVTANAMKNNPEQFQVSFFSDIQHVYGGTINESYENLIHKYVSTMGVDFSHPMIVALCSTLKFPVLIIDPKIGAPNGINVLDALYSDGTFCRCDNHYFVLYPREQAPQIILPSVQLIQPSQPRDTQRPTEIIVTCKIPSGHQLYIRGSGDLLSWEVGKPLTQIDEQTWVYCSIKPIQDMEYKFLIDDQVWQEGGNNKISNGKIDGENPRFTLAPATRITIRFPTDSNDRLFIRGNGPGMSNWSQAIELRREGNGIWTFETQQGGFENFEYKIVLNDQKWESGQNHKIESGKKEEIIPQFN